MKRIGTLVLALFLALSLSLNVATMAFSAVATVVSSVFEAVTGTRSVVSSLSAKNADLDRQLTTTKAKVTNLNSELAERDKRIATLTAEARNPSVRYRGAQRPVSEAVSDTVGRLSRRTTVAATRNVSSLFASSIPFIGVAAGVAVTGYALKDGCDNLKDLRELELALNPEVDVSEEEKRVCGIEPPTREKVLAKVRSAPGEVWESAKQYVPELPEVDFSGTVATGLVQAGEAWTGAKDAAGNAGGAVRDTWNWVWGD